MVQAMVRLQLPFLECLDMVVRPSWGYLRGWLHLLLWGESALLAESWSREVEKIFRAIRCAQEDKVSLATYMLQERADVWWASMLCTRYEDGALEVTWAEFIRLFKAKFIPEHIQDKME
ncbi:hypothetical protein Taro_051049 [Colocasia esculenta]|uniref:Retrotransposon gag domain-containing protein n=1 Tax=Colocasia esculenta TaxID=4460 RepID=A0A843XFT0_COLES|nr:hypothetical protein [Colocasia esculenta]